MDNMTYKVGDILVNKKGLKQKVLAVCGELVALSWSGDFDTYCGWSTEKKLTNYTLEAKPWEPEEGWKYWYITSTMEADEDRWRDHLADRLRRDFLGVFPTKEAAEARIAEIKKLLGR